MIGTPRRLALLLGTLAALFLGTGSVLLTAAPAQAAGCVTVVVQDQGQGCVAVGGNGITVMDRAGFQANTNTPMNQGFVCQINHVPSGCSPPSDNYWAYFHAKPGASWVYSSAGAAGYTPAAGTCDGWRYETAGAQTPPSYACPAAIAHRPSPTRTAVPAPPPPTGGAGTHGGAGTPGGADTHGSAGIPSRRPGASAPPRAAAVTAAPSAAASPAAPARREPAASRAPVSTSQAVAAVSSRSADRGSGVPGWTILGGLLVLAILTGTVVQGRRRRSS